jgi:uncharacterized protein (TIGR02246 family)
MPRHAMLMTAALLCAPPLVYGVPGLSSLPDRSDAPVAADTAASSREIDADVWTVLIETVAADDIGRMASTYHPDAVLVHPGGTEPIARSLERWGRQMAEARAKGSKASLVLRFSTRQDNTETAFEVGMFKYTVTDKSGASDSRYIPLETLLVKRDGRWRIVMERQLAALTEADWNKLPR